MTEIVPYSQEIKDEYLKVLDQNLKGESRIIEYFFGTFDGKLTIDLIYELDNVAKLYDNVDYFVKDNLSELQKYIINKYKIIYYKINYQESNISFEEENKLMEETIKIYEEKIPPTSRLGYHDENNQKENMFISKKNIIFFEKVENSDEKNKGYEFYRKKLFDEDNFDERD